MKPNKRHSDLYEKFAESIGFKELLDMFDLLPDTLFWIKDTESNIIHCNKFFLEHIGANNLNQVLGANDFAFSPPHIARQFIVDDNKVIQGNVVHNRLEMNTLVSGEIAWFSTFKRPLYNPEGKVIGSYGTSRPLNNNALASSGLNKLKVPIDFIRKHFADEISVEQLASVSSLSVSALERRFKKYMTKTPKQFINEIRLENARKMLAETSLPITIIANKNGFSDHSYFSRQFKRQFGDIPSTFRRNHHKTVSNHKSNNTPAGQQ